MESKGKRKRHTNYIYIHIYMYMYQDQASECKNFVHRGNHKFNQLQTTYILSEIRLTQSICNS